MLVVVFVDFAVVAAGNGLEERRGQRGLALD